MKKCHFGFIPRKFSHDAILAVSWKYPDMPGSSVCQIDAPNTCNPPKKSKKYVKIPPFLPGVWEFGTYLEADTWKNARCKEWS